MPGRILPRSLIIGPAVAETSAVAPGGRDEVEEPQLQQRLTRPMSSHIASGHPSRLPTTRRAP